MYNFEEWTCEYYCKLQVLEEEVFGMNEKHATLWGVKNGIVGAR